jgi:hypothetical protein
VEIAATMTKPVPFMLRLDRPETLLLRIRVETLGINLQRAHEKLKELPNLSSELTKVRGDLAAIGEQATDVLKTLARFRVTKAQLSTKDLMNQEHALEKMRTTLDEASDKLSSIESKSFLVQAQSIGQAVWKYLEDRAAQVKATVDQLDVQQKDAWKSYLHAESEANRSVFNEGIELLGGIALRDARLGAEICELADSMIKSTFRTLTRSVHTIPGGVATMMMQLEPIIRLRFPEWTIWALPLTAHEVWHARLGKEVTMRLALDASLSRISLNDSDIQQCLADAFGTYTIGPAYAFAAIMLLFDPLLPRDEARVCAVLEMLTRVSPAPQDDYAKICSALRTAWDSAKGQAAVPADAATAGAAAAPATDAATGRVLDVAAPSAPSVEDARLLADRLWHTLSKVLKLPAFGLDEWSQKSGCCDALLTKNRDKMSCLEFSHLDIRHALNAAWCVRVHPDRPRDAESALIDLTEDAMFLAQKITANAAKPAPRARSDHDLP